MKGGAKLFWLGLAAYLLSLPFVTPQAAALALCVVAFWFASTGLQTAVVAFSDLWPVLPFLAVGAISAVRAENPLLATGFFSFNVPGLILFVVAVADRRIDMRNWMRLWTLFSLAIAVSVLVGRLRLGLGAATLFGEDVPQAVLRLSGNTLLAVPNDVCATTILVAFPLGLLAAGAHRIERVAAVLAVVLALLAAGLVRSRTGFLIGASEMALAAVLRPGLLRAILQIILVAGLADAWFGFAGLQKLTLADPHDLHGVAGRLGLWVSAWRMFLSAPLLGHGALSFGPGHLAYLPDWAPHYPEGRAPWAHDLFLDVLAEQGVLGAAAFLCLVVPPVRGAWRAVLRLEGQIALCALAGLAIAACLELSFIRRVVPLLLFGLLGFAARVAAEDRLRVAGSGVVVPAKVAGNFFRN